MSIRALAHRPRAPHRRRDGGQHRGVRRQHPAGRRRGLRARGGICPGPIVRARKWPGDTRSPGLRRIGSASTGPASPPGRRAHPHRRRWRVCPLPAMACQRSRRTSGAGSSTRKYRISGWVAGSAASRRLTLISCERACCLAVSYVAASTVSTPRPACRR